MSQGSISINRVTYEKLREYAFRKNLTIASVVEAMIHNAIDKHEREKK